MKRLLILALLIAPLWGQQVNTDIIPTTTGLNLGRNNQRWNAYIQNLDISGTCTINGVSCGTGTGGSSVAFAAIINTTNTAGWSGSDGGSWINSAFAAYGNPGGKVIVSPGTYNFSTQINLTTGQSMVLECSGAGNTILNWTGGASPPLIVGGSSGGLITVHGCTIESNGVPISGQYGIYVNGANNQVLLDANEITQMGDSAIYVNGATAHTNISNNYIHLNVNNYAIQVNSTSAENVVIQDNEIFNNLGGINVLANASGVTVRDNDIESGPTGTASLPMLNLPFGQTANVSTHNTFGYGPNTTGTNVVYVNGNATLVSTGDTFAIGKTGQTALYLDATAQANIFTGDKFSGINTGVGTGFFVNVGALDNQFNMPQFFNNLGSTCVDNGTRTTDYSNLLSCAKINLLGNASFSGQISATNAFFSQAGAGAIMLVQGAATAVQPYAGWQLTVPASGAPGANFDFPNGTGPGVLETSYGTGAACTATPAAGQIVSGTGACSSGGFYAYAPGCSVTGGGGSNGSCHFLTTGYPKALAISDFVVDNPGSGYTGTVTIVASDQAETRWGNVNYRWTHLENATTLDGRVNACKAALVNGGTCDSTREPAASLSATINFTQSNITWILPPNTITEPNNVTINRYGNRVNIISKTPDSSIIDGSNNGSVGCVNGTGGDVGLLQGFKCLGGRLNGQTGFEINVSGSNQTIDNVAVSDAGAFGIQMVNCFNCKTTNSRVARSTKAGIGVNTSTLAVSSATASGSVVTITATAAQILGTAPTSTWVRVQSCSLGGYNGLWKATSTGANTFTYTAASAPGTPATSCTYTIPSIGVIMANNYLDNVNTTDTGDGGLAVQSSGGIGFTDGTQVTGNTLMYSPTNPCSNPTNTTPSTADTGCSEGFQQTDKPTNTEVAGNRIYNSYRETYATSGTGLRMHDNLCVNPANVSVGSGNGCYMLSVSSGGGLSVAGDAIISHNVAFNSGLNTSAYCLSIQAGGSSSATTFRNIEVSDNACEGLTSTFGIGIRWNNASANTMTLQNLNFHDNAFTNVTTNEQYSTTNTTGQPRSINNTPTTPTCTFTSGGGTSPSCALDTGSTDQFGSIIATTGTGAPAGTGTITLTFTIARGTNKPTCQYTASDNGAGAWNSLIVIKDKTPALANDLFTWTNGTTPTTLSTSTAYWINYLCNQK